MNEQQLRAIHAQACAAVALVSRTVTPADDQFWPLYLAAAIAAAEVAAPSNDAAVAAIKYTLEADEGLEWLRCWNEGKFKICRREWPDAPDACYDGADPMHPSTKIQTPHGDDLAVEAFACAMKDKLASSRLKGRGGWEQCNPALLSKMLREHIEKGDPVDVGNFAMMLWHHNAPTVAMQSAAVDENGQPRWKIDKDGTMYVNGRKVGGSHD